MPKAVGRVEIDTRPLWIILVSRGRTAALLLTGVLICWTITQLAPPAGLDEKGQRALAVFALCVFYWVLEVLPVMITSLLAIVLLPLLGVMSGKDAYAQFGNEAVFFILGAFILAAAMMQSGLSARLALVILRRFGHRPTAMLRGIFVLNSAMSFLMSEHAVAAMTFPIIVEIVARAAAAAGTQQLRAGALSRHGLGDDDRRRRHAARRRARAARHRHPARSHRPELLLRRMGRAQRAAGAAADGRRLGDCCGCSSPST